MVFNCKSISQEKPDSISKNNNPDEEANEMVSFFLIVHGCSYLNGVELFVKGINGVESVKCDGNSKLEVMGKVEPFKIQEVVKHETKKEVELIFPSTERVGDTDESKGTKAKFMRTVMPMPENAVANERIEESIIDLKIKLCCESCNKNLQRILKTKGLETLTIEAEKDLVTVRGTVDVTELRSYIKDKLKKDIEVVNLAKVVAPTEKGNAGAIDRKYKDRNEANRREVDGGVKVKSIVVLKMRLHCDGCIQRIQNLISKFRGVETVLVNAKEDLVTVNGTMDVQNLTSYLNKKIKSNMQVVLVEKKEDGDNENKDKYST